MNRWSTIREIQKGASVRYHLAPIRMAVTTKENGSKKSGVGEM
jgi:hypothetical protein